jgi:hypothetical protein
VPSSGGVARQHCLHDASISEVVLRGREAELRSVALLLRAATGGRGGALVFTGDAGTGKSALLAAAIAQAQAEPPEFAIVEACAWEIETGLGYAGLHRVLQRAADSGLPVVAAGALAATLDSRPDTPSEQLGRVGVPGPFVRRPRQRPCCAVSTTRTCSTAPPEALAFVAGSAASGWPSCSHPRWRPTSCRASSGGPAELDDAASQALPMSHTGCGRRRRHHHDRGRQPAAGAHRPPESLTPRARRGGGTAATAVAVLEHAGRATSGSDWPAAHRHPLVAAALAADPDLDVGELIRTTGASGPGITALEPATGRHRPRLWLDDRVPAAAPRAASSTTTPPRPASGRAPGCRRAINWTGTCCGACCTRPRAEGPRPRSGGAAAGRVLAGSSISSHAGAGWTAELVDDPGRRRGVGARRPARLGGRGFQARMLVRGS